MKNFDLIRNKNILNEWLPESEHEKVSTFFRIIDRYQNRFPSSDNTSFYKLLEEVDRETAARFFSLSQFESKDWIVEKIKELNVEFNVAYVVGSWFGLLAHMLDVDDEVKFQHILNFDKDRNVTKLGDVFNNEGRINSWKVKSITADMFDLNYDHDKVVVDDKEKIGIPFEAFPDLVINTSCEHVDLKKWIAKVPRGKMLILQSNDKFDELDHVNCHKSLDEFLNELNLSEVTYSGVLELEEYNRFMVIGKK